MKSISKKWKLTSAMIIRRGHYKSDVINPYLFSDLNLVFVFLYCCAQCLFFSASSHDISFVSWENRLMISIGKADWRPVAKKKNNSVVADFKKLSSRAV